jgi:hypothetical protein
MHHTACFWLYLKLVWYAGVAGIVIVHGISMKELLL